MTPGQLLKPAFNSVDHCQDNAPELYQKILATISKKPAVKNDALNQLKSLKQSKKSPQLVFPLESASVNDNLPTSIDNSHSLPFKPSQGLNFCSSSVSAAPFYGQNQTVPFTHTGSFAEKYSDFTSSSSSSCSSSSAVQSLVYLQVFPLHTS